MFRTARNHPSIDVNRCFYGECVPKRCVQPAFTNTIGDCARYILQSFARTQNVELQDVLIENQEQEQVEAGTAVYDLVAVVYYHSSRGPLQAIDGYPLSGSTQNQSPRKHAHQDKRRNAASNTPAARSKQAGHYTAAVFRPFQSTRRRQSADQDDPSGKKRGVQQDRNGSWCAKVSSR